ncbi:MAG: HD domain-containing protein [Oscillospiraceae bacterium]|nr:HD domain-containing protein [Oscillospiraceae bacterium]MCL2277966.1 HD domain-containing protein [Oscillospiraceae bacterium]
MKLLNSSYIVNIIENTLNHMDGRLIDHGKRVSYFVYKMLKKQNKYTKKQIRDICLLSLIHDIGAYKTEEVHNMVAFETGAVWEHSTYGYLFVKHFSPLTHLAPILLFHHASPKELEYLHPDYRELAQIIFVADRIDVLALSKIEEWDEFIGYFDEFRDILFDSDVIDLFFKGDGCVVLDDLKFDYPSEFTDILYGSEFSDDEVNAFMNMVILSIEFRSPQTMNHTFILIKVCEVLGRKAGLTDEEIEDLQSGALMHDLGKVGIPLKILESKERLSPEEFEVMKLHIDITRKILDQNVSKSVLRIATNHHEKLDGSGYGSGLRGDELTVSDRLLAVADIFCALCSKRSYKEQLPKEKVISIMADMKSGGYIDPTLTDLSAQCYEELVAGIDEVTSALVATYDDLWAEYELVLSLVDVFKTGLGTNEMYVKEPLIL